jgi:hypothetical protein
MFPLLHGLDNPPPTNSLPLRAALIAVSSSPPGNCFHNIAQRPKTESILHNVSIGFLTHEDYLGFETELAHLSSGLDSIQCTESNVHEAERLGSVVRFNGQRGRNLERQQVRAIPRLDSQTPWPPSFISTTRPAAIWPYRATTMPCGSGRKLAGYGSYNDVAKRFRPRSRAITSR